MKKIKNRNILFLIYRLAEIFILLLVHFVYCILRLFRSAFYKSSIQPFPGFITDFFEAAGGSFIKLGQIMSSRPDIFTHSLTASLARLQDKVKPFKYKRVVKIFCKSYGIPPEELFSFFEPIPIASGSISQVHRAKLKNSTIHVAVKIKRPGIDQKIICDFLILKTFIRLVKWMPFLKIMPLSELVEEFRITIEGQLSFENEVRANKRFASMFKKDKQILIPFIYEELCTSEIIVMEYFPDLKKVQDLSLQAYEKELAALTALKGIYKMMFNEGFIHGDLHPGNLFFLDGGRVLLLDFGLVAELKGEELEDYIEFFFSMATNNGKECARIVHKTALFLSPNFEYSRFEKEMEEMIHYFYNLNVEEFEVSAFATRLFNIERKNGIKGATHFITVILALMVFEGVAKQLHPKLDFQDEAKKVLVEIFEKA